jgi:hypothetical protein
VKVDCVTDYGSDRQIYVLFTPSKGPFCNKFLFTFRLLIGRCMLENAIKCTHTYPKITW